MIKLFKHDITFKTNTFILTSGRWKMRVFLGLGENRTGVVYVTNVPLCSHIVYFGWLGIDQIFSAWHAGSSKGYKKCQFLLIIFLCGYANNKRMRITGIDNFTILKEILEVAVAWLSNKSLFLISKCLSSKCWSPLFQDSWEKVGGRNQFPEKWKKKKKSWHDTWGSQKFIDWLSSTFPLTKSKLNSIGIKWTKKGDMRTKIHWLVFVKHYHLSKNKLNLIWS